MFLSIKKIVYSLIIFSIGYLLIGYFGDNHTKQFKGYYHGNVRRLFSVYKLAWLMGYLSYLAHIFLSSFFNEPYTYVKFTSTYGKFSQRILNRWKSRMTKSWTILCIMAMGLYFLYFINDEHTFLYLIFGWANGLWVHIFMFSFGFIVLTILRSGMERIHYLNEIFNFVYKCKFIKKFCTDTQFQVLFTIGISVILCCIQGIAADKVYVKHHTLKIKNLPSEAEGLKFALVTDVHTGAMVYKNQVANIVEKVNDENVDAIFLVGDIIDSPYQLIKNRTEPMKHFKSKYGTYFVTGNHEYYYGNVQDWIDAFRNDYGFKILENEITDMKGICLVGLHDISAAKNNITNHVMNASIINECPDTKPIIVLAHNPAATKEIINSTPNKPVDLILSGHTHAGQYYVMIPYILVFLPYYHGFYNVGNDTTLFVSAGTLYQAAPMKMPFFSEIHVFTLNKE
ncbi:Transmembrane protein with metallophosphoesterase domain [Strongyloides ratti]|uniref:Transmembrane protein with metallophosphoesterase domain n=1 Tax=Strongyloides ratti TaxID=34506 RepID=A0A090LAF9_STRRB|nr:Transmembrane protein with metallophosphoesterase domain [Strongyloides ratti]CEF66751.1 Transmembrane protein with metallophosphoesterase domain [Strongyloides ratti]